MLAGIEEIIKRIREKYCLRVDARDKIRSHGKKNEWITVKGTHVKVGDKGQLGGEVGKKIEETQKEAGKGQKHTQNPSGEDVKAELQRRIDNGKVSLKVNRKKQAKHIRGSEEYKKAVAEGHFPSELTLSRKAQELVLEKAMEDGVCEKRKNGSIRIYYEANQTVGKAVLKDGSASEYTRCVEVHFSKDGTHLVPVPRREDDGQD